MSKKTTFVDREEELALLGEAYRYRPGFLVLYGRRRIGKTRLLQEFLKKHNGVYYLARLTSHKDNLNGLCSSIEKLYPGFCRGKEYSSLDVLLYDLAKTGCNLVVIDEFTYWVRTSSQVLSELQYFVDNVLPKTNTLLIISGSLIGVIEREVIGGGSPLYGRRTKNIKLSSFKPWHIKGFLPHYSTDERVMSYSVVGGVPYYLELLAQYNKLNEALRKTVFSKHGVLYVEPDFLLHEEFRNPSVYSRILKAISNGYNRLGKISEYTGIPKTHLPIYLEKLERIGFIKRIVPLWCKRGYYVVSDYFLRFYYYVVEKVKELIELELEDEAWSEAERLLKEYMGLAFEQVAWDLVPLMYKRKLVPKPAIMGKYLYRDIDVDLIIIDPRARRACMIEVKWSIIDDYYAEEIISSLRRKKDKIKRLDEYTVDYLVIARRNRAVKYRDRIIDIASLGL